VKKLNCIICPLGCSLKAEEEQDGTITVSGNRCPRGAAYAQEEIRAPRRVVTATCAIRCSGPDRPDAPLGGARRLPVKSSQACPRERIQELLADIYALSVTLPVKAGDLLISRWKGTGIDIVAVRSLDASQAG
jgi:CxxC motif-containing protein